MPDHVHVIAVVDFAERTGEIKYVIPVTAAPAAGGQPDGRVRLRLRGRDGAVLAEIDPPVSLMACEVADAAAAAVGGMVQHTIAAPPGATRLELVVGGAVADTFDTGVATADAPGTRAFAFDDVAAAGAVAPAAVDARAVSYTIQARPVGSTQWQTLAAGQAAPEYAIDANQFGGASAADVRVIRNSGFSAAVISEQRTDFGSDTAALGDPE